MEEYGENTHGRRKIFTAVDNINEQNIIGIVNSALQDFSANVTEEEMLYMYRRGLTPVRNRKKERNTFVCNKVNENHADEIVSFKNGFFLTQPAFYVSRSGKSQGKVNKLNEYLYRSGKHHADNKVVDWFHTVGVGVMYV